MEYLLKRARPAPSVLPPAPPYARRRYEFPQTGGGTIRDMAREIAGNASAPAAAAAERVEGAVGRAAGRVADAGRAVSGGGGVRGRGKGEGRPACPWHAKLACGLRVPRRLHAARRQPLRGRRQPAAAPCRRRLPLAARLLGAPWLR